MKKVLASLFLIIYFNTCECQVCTIKVSDDTAMCVGSSVQLKAQGAGIISYTWTPETGLSDPTVQNPIATPTSRITYTVQGQTTDGCIASASVTISLLNCTKVLQLCANSDTVLKSNIAGTSYQWQSDTGNGFNNLVNDSNYTGVNSINLQLNNISSAFYGYKYRCIVDGSFSNISILQFSNKWTGEINSEWENPSNWSCGTIPDMNTDVIISDKTVILNSNATIRSLIASSGTTITINPGFNLTIIH